MAERELVSVLWREWGDQIEVTYDDGHIERMVGSQAYAVQLARVAELDLAHADDDSVRWVRDGYVSE